MKPAVMQMYLKAVNRMLLTVELYAYRSPDTRKAGAHLTRARTEIKDATHQLNSRRVSTGVLARARRGAPLAR